MQANMQAILQNSATLWRKSCGNGHAGALTSRYYSYVALARSNACSIGTIALLSAQLKVPRSLQCLADLQDKAPYCRPWTNAVPHAFG